MAEYIEREALKQKIEDTKWYHRNCYGNVVQGAFDENNAFYKATDIFEAIHEHPAADVVEVVRCKNCKNYNTANCSDGFGWCESSNSGTHDDRYCSEGERKE